MAYKITTLKEKFSLLNFIFFFNFVFVIYNSKKRIVAANDTISLSERRYFMNETMNSYQILFQGINDLVSYFNNRFRCPMKIFEALRN